jgi:hypothetical protein
MRELQHTEFRRISANLPSFPRRQYSRYWSIHI